MATARKKYFRQPDSILREPWSREVKLTSVLLRAHLNTRWRRDGIPNEEAGRCTLSRGDLYNITGKTWLVSGQNLLRTLAELGEISIKTSEDLTEIDWPNFAEYQNFGTRSEGSSEARDEPRPSPAPTPAPKRESDPPPADPLPPEEQDVAPLMNFIAGLEGEPDEKLAWLESGVGREIIGGTNAEMPTKATIKQRSGKLLQITSARYRTYLKTERVFKGAASKKRVAANIAAFEAAQSRDPPATDLKPGEPIPPEIQDLFA